MALDINTWRGFYAKEMSDDLDPDYLYDAGYADALENVNDWMEEQLKESTSQQVHCSTCNKSYIIQDVHGNRIRSCIKLGIRGLKDSDYCSFGQTNN